MPFPSTHIDCALGYIFITHLEGKNKDDFLLGNLLPDLKIDGILNRADTHYYEKGKYTQREFVEDFFEKEEVFSETTTKEEVNYILLGYLFHLIVDHTFITHNEGYKDGTMEKFMWEGKRKHNALKDFEGDNRILEEINKTKTTITNITHKDLPKVFNKVEIEKLKSDYIRGVDTIIELTNHPFSGFFSDEEINRDVHTKTKENSIDNFLYLAHGMEVGQYCD